VAYSREPPPGPSAAHFVFAFLFTPSAELQLPVQGVAVRRIDGAPAKETAHYPKMARRRMCFRLGPIETMETFDETAVRFFGAFNFMNPAQACQPTQDTL
jgi:hypothetical protein